MGSLKFLKFGRINVLLRCELVEMIGLVVFEFVLL